ncbi:sensor histidine kinase [Gracilibacillus alcaliphilus]|uniref:sensor histidine kinase n=1 Tax=Gracilibacillus alcaliphilus TaxID=1401441 RepID=UPI00195901E2|nr:HAMP domain-containing sensor histidine kinase [Gracilibacillus alcaliphilus]MBM7675281.1 signal transduction histidine kinase [Gracilibacillus alcaliphilus]
MKSGLKNISKWSLRFLGLLMLSIVLLVVLNSAFLSIYVNNQSPNGSPWKSAQGAAEAIKQENGEYILQEEIVQELIKEQAWAIFIDDRTKEVVWHSDNLPDDIPKDYTLSDIASLTRGYVNDYPTFTGEAEEGLMVVGYPKESFWKHISPSWDYQFIENLPQNTLILIVSNLVVIFLIYMAANYKLLKSVGPIVEGIQYLPKNENVNVKEKGPLSELAVNINQTSEILQSQQRMLQKKEEARSNWIAGVSHDIRTPLSMVMGYIGQLEEEENLDQESRQKMTVIRKQSEKIKQLIDDLNLASKLEYNMQPLHLKDENIIAVVREVAVEFINIDLAGKYPIEWIVDEQVSACILPIDKSLWKRAIGNLIQNSINHNENGCKIYISIIIQQEACTVSVADNGVGMTAEQMDVLNNTPHYMLDNDHKGEIRHGLGLLIVKQIAASHGGDIVIEASEYGGLAVRIVLPFSATPSNDVPI